MSPTIRKWLPGMVASITPYTLRSNIPEAIASNAICGTPGKYSVNGTTGLVEVSTLDGTENSGDMIAGFIVRTATAKYVETTDWTEAKYEDGEPVTLLTTGDMAVNTEVAVSPGDPVFFRHTAEGAFTEVNLFTNVGDAGTTPIFNAAFVENTTTAGLAVVNIPGRCYVGS